MGDSIQQPVELKKTLGTRDITLFCVSAILLLDTLAAGAVGGPSVLFWWLCLGLIFMIPNALITAELGCSFPEQGGIYAWVRDAFGERWSARMIWAYWANIAVWMPAIFILFAGIFSQLFFPDLSMAWQMAICIFLSWVTVGVSILTLELGKWIPNISAMIKVLVFIVIILGGFMLGTSQGAANSFTLASMAPDLDGTLQYLPVLIYGMLGFELVCAGSAEMKNPRRDIPRGMFISGALILSAYTAATAAILVAIPATDIDLVEGLMDTLYVLLPDSDLGRGIAMALGVGTLFTIFANAVTWSLGGNRAVAEAALEGHMPAWLGIESQSQGTPQGAAIGLGVISTAIILLYGALAGSNEDLFWDLFACSAVLFILPYVLMSMAFVQLRRKYPDKPRPYRVPGGDTGAWVLAVTCVLILSITIALFCYIPGEGMQWMVFGGSVLFLAAGEFIVRRAEKLRPAQPGHQAAFEP